MNMNIVRRKSRLQTTPVFFVAATTTITIKSSTSTKKTSQVHPQHPRPLTHTNLPQTPSKPHPPPSIQIHPVHCRVRTHSCNFHLRPETSRTTSCSTTTTKTTKSIAITILRALKQCFDQTITTATATAAFLIIFATFSTPAFATSNNSKTNSSTTTTTSTTIGNKNTNPNERNAIVIFDKDFVASWDNSDSIQLGIQPSSSLSPITTPSPPSPPPPPPPPPAQRNPQSSYRRYSRNSNLNNINIKSNTLPSPSLQLEAQILSRLLVALVVGGVIGMERRAANSLAGVRTFSLVSLGAAVFMSTTLTAFPNADPTRVAAAISSSVGFLGAGAMHKNAKHSRGLTTASSVWLAAALGIAAAAGLFLLSFSGAVATVLIARYARFNSSLHLIRGDPLRAGDIDEIHDDQDEVIREISNNHIEKINHSYTTNELHHQQQQQQTYNNNNLNLNHNNVNSNHNNPITSTSTSNNSFPSTPTTSSSPSSSTPVIPAPHSKNGVIINNGAETENLRWPHRRKLDGVNLESDQDSDDIDGNHITNRS